MRRVVDQRFARAKTALRNVVEEAMGAAFGTSTAREREWQPDVEAQALWRELEDAIVTGLMQAGDAMVSRRGGRQFSGELQSRAGDGVVIVGSPELLVRLGQCRCSGRMPEGRWTGYLHRRDRRYRFEVSHGCAQR